MENYLDIEILAHVIQHGGLIKNIEGESTEANDLESGAYIIPNVTNVFTKLNPSRGI